MVWAARSRLTHLLGNWVPGLPGDLAGRARVGLTLRGVFKSLRGPDPHRKLHSLNPGLRMTRR